MSTQQNTTHTQQYNSQTYTSTAITNPLKTAQPNGFVSSVVSYLLQHLFCSPRAATELDPGFDLLPPPVYRDFLQRIHSPSGVPLFQSIVGLSDEWKNQPHLLLRSVGEICLAYSGDPLWKPLAINPLPQRPYLAFCLERFLLDFLHPRVYPSSEADLQNDIDLYNHISKLVTFITPQHLDLPQDFPFESFLGPAREELFYLSTPKSPVEKLQCLVRCCKFLLVGLKEARAGKPLGADDFVPALIYLIIHVNPPGLCSNIKYIQEFVSPWWEGSEAQYYLVAVEGAIQYLISIDENSLSISQQDFLQHMENAEKVYAPIRYSEESLLRHDL